MLPVSFAASKHIINKQRYKRAFGGIITFIALLLDDAADLQMFE